MPTSYRHRISRQAIDKIGRITDGWIEVRYIDGTLALIKSNDIERINYDH